MAVRPGQVRAGRGLAPARAAVALGTLITALTVAGLVAIALAHQSEGQFFRLLSVLLGRAARHAGGEQAPP